MKVKFYARYSWHMKATAEVAVSDGSERSTTEADAKLLDRDDIAPGRSNTRTDSLGRHQPPHPLSTEGVKPRPVHRWMIEVRGDCVSPGHLVEWQRKLPRYNSRPSRANTHRRPLN